MKENRSRLLATLCLLAGLCACNGTSGYNASNSPDGSAPGANPPGGDTPQAPGSGGLEQENIGTRERVAGTFDRWRLKTSVTMGRGLSYAEVTAECRDRADENFVLTAAQWQDADRRTAYYTETDAMIDRVAAKLLADNGNKLPAAERAPFLRALKALAWQESRWQHYARHKDWLFVLLSGGSMNALDDWGIAQVARSSFGAEDRLNVPFFDGRGYCSIEASLAYGFSVYYRNYLEARSLSCNGDPMTKLVGAYNRYSSGYSACHNAYSNDADYRNYQMNAMKGFRTQYDSAPWTSLIAP